MNTMNWRKITNKGSLPKSSGEKKCKNSRIKFFQLEVFFVVLAILLSSLSAYSQEYLRIEGTKYIFRYYPNSPKSYENINDNIIVRTQKQKANYKIEVIKSSKRIVDCLYAYNGKTASQNLRTRTWKKDGSKIMRKKIVVKILNPVNEDCVTRLITD